MATLNDALILTQYKSYSQKKVSNTTVTYPKARKQWGGGKLKGLPLF